MRIADYRKLELFERFNQTPKLASAVRCALRKEFHCSTATFRELLGEWRKQRDTNLKMRAIAGRNRSGGIGVEVDENETDADARMVNVLNVAYRKALEGSYKHAELLARISGKLVDRSEIKVGRLEADDYYRIIGEAEKELEPNRTRKLQGDSKVSKERKLLLETPRVDSEQEHGAEGSVAELGLSTSSFEGTTE